MKRAHFTDEYHSEIYTFSDETENLKKYLPKLRIKDIINESCKRFAEIAQSVEHFTRNEGVVGSSPIFSLSGAIRKGGFFIYEGSPPFP